jgi:hypothetical protein
MKTAIAVQEAGLTDSSITRSSAIPVPRVHVIFDIFDLTFSKQRVGRGRRLADNNSCYNN